MPRLSAVLSATPSRAIRLSSLSNQPVVIEKRIPPTQAFLQGAIRQARHIPLGERLLSGSIGGLPTALGGSTHAEEALPLVGQTLAEGIRATPVGHVPGVPFATAVAGATVGEALRQGIRHVRGEPTDLGAIGRTATATAATEGIARGAGSLFERLVLRRPFLQASLRQLGEHFGAMRRELLARAPDFHYDATPIVEKIETILAQHPFERGAARTALVQLKDDLTKFAGAQGTLTLDQLLQIEQRLGDVGVFVNMATGRLAREPKAPQLNQALKVLRSQISQQVDAVAKSVGLDEFIDVSRRYGELAKRVAIPPASAFTRMVRSGFMYPALYAAGAGPTGATLGTAASFFLQDPRLANALFRGIRSATGRAVGRGATIGASELARQTLSP